MDVTSLRVYSPLPLSPAVACDGAAGVPPE